MIERTDLIDGEIPATFPTEIFTEDEINILNQLPLIGSEDPRMQYAVDLAKETRKNLHVPPTHPPHWNWPKNCGTCATDP